MQPRREGKVQGRLINGGYYGRRIRLDENGCRVRRRVGADRAPEGDRAGQGKRSILVGHWQQSAEQFAMPRAGKVADCPCYFR